MTSLLRWWQTRQPREQRLIGLAAFISFCWLLQLSWQQAIDFRQRAQQQLAREQQALQLLPQWELALQQRLPRSENLADAPTAEALHALAQQHGLSLHITSQTSGWQLEQPATLTFAALLQWLAAIESRWGLQASQLEIARDKQEVKLLKLELKHGR